MRRLSLEGQTEFRTISQRKGDYLGKTVQIVPHVTNAIQDWIERVSKIPSDDTGEQPDVCIIEVRRAYSFPNSI